MRVCAQCKQSIWLGPLKTTWKLTLIDVHAHNVKMCFLWFQV